MSPAPNVSTASTGNAAVSCRPPDPSSQIVSFGPRVPARKDEVKAEIVFSAARSSAMSAVSCSVRWRRSGARRWSRVRPAATSRGRRQRSRRCRACALRRRGRCRTLRSGSRSGWRRNPRAGVDAGQLDRPQLRIAEDDDGSFAARVDDDRRDQRDQPRHVHEVIRLDAFLGEPRPLRATMSAVLTKFFFRLGT
jgi:hypothetical protein